MSADKEKAAAQAAAKEEQLRQYLAAVQAQFDAVPCAEPIETYTREEQMLPMRDGVRLHLLTYKPGTPGPWPTIVQRSCYPVQAPIYELYGKELARRGYAYAVQTCRGTGKSEGQWVPNENERDDGLDLMAWLDAQPWVESIGYFGASYLALTGWAIADAVPAKVKGMMLTVYGCDRFTSAYEKRMFRHDVLTGWAMQNAGFPVTADYLESCRYWPHEQVDEALWGGKLPWYQDWIHSPDRDDPYWHQGWWKKLAEIPTQVKIPLYIVDAWYDHHFGSAMTTYARLPEEVRAHSWLDIGCWNHISMNCIEWAEAKHLENGDIPRMLTWFDLLLRQKKLPEPRVRAYIMGEDRWQEYPGWPVQPAAVRRFHLGADRALTEAGAAAGEVTFRYDPKDPCPTHGAESVLTTLTEAGSLLQPPPDYRPDVVSFVSAPLEAPMTICGPLRVKLNVATDGEDTAFTAKLMEVFEDGRAVNIRGSITTIAADLPAGASYTPGSHAAVTVEMWDMVWTVRAGSRLRLDISSSDFPQYSVHANYPGVWASQSETRVAQQTVFCGPEGSVVEIPVA